MCPKKRKRCLYSDEEIKRARAHCLRSESAKHVKDSIVEEADFWADHSDESLYDLIPPPEVPRAFNISFSGCPVCGRDTFKYGNYGFETPIETLWKVRCPNCGSVFPSNDFGTFLRSGLKDRSLLTGDYADDGWGWKKEGEEKNYWFVAYYCHWHWIRHIFPALSDLSQAYMLTGDRTYAHKAAVMLCRIADFYPSMDYNKQSRYAAEFLPTYTGKILYHTWETNTVDMLSACYDLIWDTIDEDTVLQHTLKMDGKQISAHIEKNLISEFIENVYNSRILGNYGKHQMSLLTACFVADNGSVADAVKFVLSNTGTGVHTHEGLDYALVNFMFREGIGHESSPAYSFGWTRNILNIAEMLRKVRVSIYDRPEIKMLFYYPYLNRVLDRYTPCIGDTFNPEDGMVELEPWMAEVGYRAYREPLFIDCLPERDDRGERIYIDFRDLMSDDLPDSRDVTVDKSYYDRSHHLGGYGIGILRSGTEDERRAVSLYYGWAGGGHGHYDRLSMEMYALGKKVMPDLGYPQFAADDPERYGWTSNTISHNTVVVNEAKQSTLHRGRLNRFVETSSIHLMDASAEAAYPGMVDLYRRAVCMIDLSDGNYYLVDIFRVQGGHQYDYSLHGPDGEFSWEGIAFAPREGTLAGREVPFGLMYDDAERSKPGRESGWGGYVGSGFSFLTNVQEGQSSAPWFGTWKLVGGEGRLRIHWLPIGETEFFACDGNPPFGRCTIASLKYVISRGTGDEGLASTFVSIAETSAGDLSIQSVHILSGSERDVAIEVVTSAGKDIILSSLDEDVSFATGDISIQGGSPRGELIGGYRAGGTCGFNDNLCTRRSHL